MKIGSFVTESTLSKATTLGAGKRDRFREVGGSTEKSRQRNA